MRSRNVLRYIDWVESLLWREAHTWCFIPDLDGRWQRDLSWNELAEIVGIDPPMLAPGDLPLNIELAIWMYWPGSAPVIDTQQQAC